MFQRYLQKCPNVNKQNLSLKILMQIVKIAQFYSLTVKL
jgi:hypothetical protein